jgi:MoxR-like ATPase
MYEHFFTWHVKSTTKAKEGLYEFDLLQRMYDLSAKNESVDMDRYIRYGAMAKAFMAKPNGDKPNILLIDEVDKADIDFPNDLLLELDRKMFVIPELEGKEVRAMSGDLLIFITSNQEKELPPAFLRRCLYCYIDFPEKETLEKIASAHCLSLEAKDPLFQQALQKFIDLRERVADKKPATSELLDWFNMIQRYYGAKREELSEAEKLLFDELEKFRRDQSTIPYAQILFKTQESFKQYAQAHE